MVGLIIKFKYKKKCKHEMFYRTKGGWYYGTCDKCSLKTEGGLGIPERIIKSKD